MTCSESKMITLKNRFQFYKLLFQIRFRLWPGTACIRFCSLAATITSSSCGTSEARRARLMSSSRHFPTFNREYTTFNFECSCHEDHQSATGLPTSLLCRRFGPSGVLGHVREEGRDPALEDIRSVPVVQCALLLECVGHVAEKGSLLFSHG